MKSKDSLKEKMLKEIFDDLKEQAYNAVYHDYSVKETNQIIRRYFEVLINASEQCQKRDELIKAYEEFDDFMGFMSQYPNDGSRLFGIRDKIETLKSELKNTNHENENSN
jgi:hypothetical protein